MQKKTKVCMIVQNKMVKGGIAAVVSGYYGSKLEQDYDMIYVESYKDGGKLTKLFKGICGYFHFAKVLLVDSPDIVHMHSSFGPSFYRYAVCPLSGDDRPIRAKRNIEGNLNGEDGYNFSCQIGKNLVKDYIHTGAITLLPDEEGFLYPVVDAEICIRCYKCINACPNH